LAAFLQATETSSADDIKAATRARDCGRTNVPHFDQDFSESTIRPPFAREANTVKKASQTKGGELIHLLANISRSSRLDERALHASLQGPNSVRCHLRQTRQVLDLMGEVFELLARVRGGW
jgi:hypothetical protein